MLRRSSAAAIRLFFILGHLSQSTAKDFLRQCFEVRNAGICYFQPTNGKEMNWDEADKFCKDNNATLPVILTSDHQRTIEEYLSPFKMNNTIVFTAGRKSSSPESRHSWRWVNGKPLRTPIGVNEEDNVFGCIKFHVVIIHNAITSCSFHPRPFICQYPGSVQKTLDNEITRLYFGSHWFVFYAETLPWHYARNKCLEGGGDLANFDDVDSLMPFHNFTLAAKALLGYTSYFIGLQNKWWTWRVRWSFDIRYTNWPNNGYRGYIPKDSPYKNCLCLDGGYDFKWLSCDCLKGKSILCQSVIGPKDKFSNASRCYQAGGTRVCYFTPKNATRLDFRGASQWCKNYDATLPIIRDKASQKSLESFLKTISMPSYYFLWTEGLKVKPGYWRWINDQPFQESYIGDISFILHPRSNETLEQKGRLLQQDNEPNGNVGYICQIPGDSCKALNNSINSKNGECLVVNEEQMSWYKARNRCIDDGGDLATFEDFSIVEKFIPLLTFNKYYHIGLENSRWKWHQSDSFVQYTNWNASVRGYSITESDLTCQLTKAHICARELENSRLCLCLETFTYKWTPCDCNFTFPFVCQQDELTKRCGSSSQPRKPEPKNEQFINQELIIAGVEGLIIAVGLLSIIVVSLTRRLKKKNETELEMQVKGEEGYNTTIQSNPPGYQDLDSAIQAITIYEEVQ